MKKTICFVLALAGILIIACNNPKKDTKVNPYAGAWEFTSYTYNVHYLNGQKPDTTIVVPNTFPYNVKLLTKKHYSVGHQTENDELVGGGGEYTYNGDSVTCIRRYSAEKGRIGKPNVWKSKIEGDLWTYYRDTIYKNDTVQWKYVETWKRIPE